MAALPRGWWERVHQQLRDVGVAAMLMVMGALVYGVLCAECGVLVAIS